ncbi:alpha/beta fold hydrolase [Luteipulveratus flavus]|uniref:Alpha/beta fold hydrolase n=1 Tax=Luteipulveratus flavus TaxID=3031728 RepID=A0ABT6C9S1_9MICO|nr:alpha/beta fold hydrolase [Luteipulveratus sp. YIM 133296]MDF8264804.1 alpha/beta fold hydrolase [Luteipulveratus sp. YIM 133296]
MTGTPRTHDGAVIALQDDATDAPPLLLLPGQASSHTWWDDLRNGLRPAYRTITFDYRGTGDTQADEAGWSTALLADDAAAVLAACGVERAHVYATSMGGRVAQELALRHPDLVDRLVLACTSPGGAGAQERDADVRRRLASPDPAARDAALLDLMYTPARARSGAPSRLLGDPTMTARARQLHLRASAGHDAWDRLPQITAPTLVLHGSDDLMAPASNAHAIAGRIPGARAEITEGGRHGFFDEFSATVTPRVAAFVGGAS